MPVKIEIKKDQELGVWQGMGGAITEATAYNFSKLSKKKQDALLEAYYGKNGLDYRWGRISIGSNDFCLKSYDYTRRRGLKDFSVEHDEKWVLPMLRKILAQKDLTLVASPWSPPRCMKFLRMRRFGGLLEPWNFGAYARYIRKWLKKYEEKGVKVSYLTPQNEPHAFQIWESCFLSFRAQRRLAYKYLVRELADMDVRILLWDHNKQNLEKVADELLTGEYGTDKKVAGLCYHWYRGTHEDKMWAVRQKYPNAMFVSSEMCCGYSPYGSTDWRHDANLYLFELMSDINCGASAWVDWNMLLSYEGGPSYCKNYVKSPVILNEAGDDFILTPIYEALRDFAKLFPAGSEVVRCECDSKDVVAVARKAKGGYELVLRNCTWGEQEVELTLDKKKKSIKLNGLELRAVKMV